jgi:cobalt/nickel transport system permease protein
MADTLISPAVGGVMLAAAGAAAAYSIRKVRNEIDEKKIPLMGVMGAFVFAAQMINFAIPGTGSSGHIGGGILLAVLLGPYAGFLTMASILLIQALIFADGGLLAYGCNVFNLGFYTCFLAYPLLYKLFTRKVINPKRILVASMVSALVGLQMGSFSVVLETLLSGKTELPFGLFVLWMQPIHLAIGVVEGLVTAAVVTFVWRSRPEILERTAVGEALGNISIKKVIAGLSVAVILTGGVFSWFASTDPDGLEWSMFKTSGETEIEAPGGIHETLAKVQNKMAVLPDYSFKTDNSEEDEKSGDEQKEGWSPVSTETSISGLVGGFFTLALIAFTGIIISAVKRKKRRFTDC